MILTRIFHNLRSRRREEVDGTGVVGGPPPHVGGYSLSAFRARCEIIGLRAKALVCVMALALLVQLSPAHAQSTKDTNFVYLFSTFKEPDQDGLRFAFSFDGYHWTNVPGLFLKPNVGGKVMRDPSLLRGPDGTFHVVWTSAWRGDPGFGYAHSKDLVHWSEQKFIPVMTNEPTTVNVWAPELFYDEKENQFIICWASTIPGRFPDHLEPHENNHRMYCTTTRDFKTFTPTKLFLDPDFSVIDCQILKDDARYVLLLKDNTRPQRNVRVAFGESALGPWRDISAPFTTNFTEGPSALKIGDDWIIYYEAYQAKHYCAAKTRDFKTFTDVSGEMTFPDGLKHGTAFKATRKDLDRLLRAGAAENQNSTDAFLPVQLRCEYAVNPMGIDVPKPRLFWRLESKEHGQRQTACQTLVASSSDLLAKDNGDLWDSGKVATDETTHIHYSGKELKSSQQVIWKVRAWDKDGKSSPWSAPATWTMGVVGTNDWQAKWICAPAATETLLLRKEFAVKPGLVRAIAHVSGLGQYEMNLNGTKAGDDLLSPGWTDYNDTVLYDTKDVTALLREGKNAVGLTLGNGMYNVVRRNRFVKFTGSFGALRAICQLQLEYADGSKEAVGTDETWRTTAGPTIFSSIYGGEDFNARLNPIGWDKSDFDESLWRPAVQLVRPPGRLRGQSVAANPLREIEVHKPVATRTLTNGDVVYDLGQNASHMPRIRVAGPVGTTVRLTPSEIISDDGSINQGTMGAGRRGSSWWEFTKATDGEETWMPKFCYIGCRYMQARLTPAPKVGQASRLPETDVQPGSRLASLGGAGETPALLSIKSLEGVVVHSSAAPVGDFECSNELLNRTRTLVRWAQRANMVSVLTDCPHREKLGWLEQYHLNGPSIRYEFDVSQIFTKGMNDMVDAQEKNGFVPNIAPEYTKFDGTFRAATEWGSAFIIVPWQQYHFDADLDLLRTHYDRMKRYFGYLESIATNDIVSEGLGDWYDLVPGRRPGVAQLTLPPVTATAFYYHDAWILSRVAALLGKTGEAKDFATRAERIRASYNKKFFNRDTGSYASNSQCANALPLVLGIVEPGNRAAVLASLVRDVESRGYAMTAGDVGFRFLLQALAQGGRSDVIYKMINQDDKPGYGYQLKKGATSLTESWDANNSSSHNHFMLGQITEWFYKDLAGIASDPDGPGFKKIIIQPTPVGDLKWVEASYDSLRGPIKVRWEHDGGKFRLNVTIPANVTATVFMPAKSAEHVAESGAPVGPGTGVKFLRLENERAVYAIGSGSYEFESQF